jgi:formylglycine-generating enzyme required for sulfatase activity/serine/threonine protein kinase
MLIPNSVLQNRYRVVRLLGQGGMGSVYEAIDQRVSCVVALKETLVGANNEARDAFQREAALLANLRHASLPKVMDYFSEGASEFLVMEYIAGHDLAELLELRNGPFPQHQVLRWADELLELLDYLHTREPPILHRDIKPANLKVTSEGEIFLLDFGLAKGVAGQMATMQTSHSVYGYTPVYAPIEQIHGSGTDPRSDLYALGATLYDLLTGQPPVGAPARFEAIENDQPDPLLPCNEINPQISADVAGVVKSAMELSRRDRPASAAEMRKSLREIAEPGAKEDDARRAEAALANTVPNRPETDESKPLFVDQDVQFTVYAPLKIKPEKIYTLLAFAHLSKRRDDAPEDERDPIEEMKDQAARILGDQRPDYHDLKKPSSQPIPRGGDLTFVPVVQGISFSPARRSFTWRKSVHREEFDMWAERDFDGQTLTGRMTVFLGSVIIAEVPLTITVDSQTAPAAERISIDAPQSARRVRQVFASYSQQDEPVVAELANLAPLFGSRFLLDRTHLEPGEDRRQGLQRLIREADVFQLFWSRNAMRSADTVDEIKYAATLGRPGFILPTYWEDPLPRDLAAGLPPPEIERLNFYRIYPGAISTAAFGGTRITPGATVVESSALNQIAGRVMTPPAISSYRDRSPTMQGQSSGSTSPSVGSVAFFPSAAGVDGDQIAARPDIVACTNCGARFAAGIAFCGRCGGTGFRQVSGVNAPAPQPAAPQMMSTPSVGQLALRPAVGGWKRKAIPIFGAVAVVFLVVIVAPVWLMMNRAEKSASVRPNTAPIVTSNPNQNTNSPAPRAGFINTNGIEFVEVLHGSFTMGAADGDADEKPVHRVTIKNSFFIGKYEVTQAQWQSIMGNQPSAFKDCGGNCPVDSVTWDDTQKFIQRLNQARDGYTYRLPSEAEWEYACRAGTTGDYAGDDVKEMAWFAGNSNERTHAVGLKQPNAWGVADMHGNVWEWCEDWYHETYYGAPVDGSAWLIGGDQKYRVLRGGSWNNDAKNLRSAYRDNIVPTNKNDLNGFRVVAVKSQ